MNGKVDVKAINAALKNHSELLAFELVKPGAYYDLKLTLGNQAGNAIVVLCSDVQNLELNPAGNGFERLLRLQVEDMRDDGLDRIHFSVEELERETLFLHCAEITLQLKD